MPITILIPVGQRFGRLTVVSGPHRGGIKVKYECKCDCGTQDLFVSQSLREGKSQSCGCRKSEVSAKLKRTHGESGTKLYWVWQGMHARCENPKHIAYRSYGAKGISVDPEFSSYESFSKWAMENGYADGLTIERKDNSRNYCPDNCVLADHTAQARNKTNNRRVTFNGQTLCVTEWAERTGISQYTIYKRLDAGWPIERALTKKTPKLR
jgi:hypothetical protein